MAVIQGVIDRLEQGWPPESIVKRYKETTGKRFAMSVSTIYRYAELDLFRLSRKGRKRRNHVQETRGKMPSLKSIHARRAPRREAGHREADTVIGKSHKNQILTLTERTSRSTIIQKMEAKDSQRNGKRHHRCPEEPAEEACGIHYG